MSPLRVLVVGAGPAGTRAAETLVRHGLRPVVVDEGWRSGGQIYRRPPGGVLRPAKALYGFEADKAVRMHSSFDELIPRIDYRPESLVWNLWQGSAYVLGPRGHETVPYDALLLATGAMDRVLPFPGWTLPGVFTLGGAQVALKAQGCLVGRRTAFVGTGPLLYLVAYQYLRAGGAIAAVLDSASLVHAVRALPDLLSLPATLAKGLYYRAKLALRRVPHFAGARPLEALGRERIEALRFLTAAAGERRVDCDALALGYGLKSETQLADLARCPFRFESRDRQWLPEHDEEGRAPVPGLYLAGDGAGVLGADAAELRGELAALALIADNGGPSNTERRAALRRRLGRFERFRDGLERAFPFPHRFAAELAEETILCRCEAVRVGELRKVLAEQGAHELNRAKALSRVGMGRCQGRVCGAAAAEIAAAARGVSLNEVGRLRGQAPVKPLPIAACAANGERG